MMPIWQITIFFFQNSFSSVFEFLVVVGHFIWIAFTHLQTLHFNKSIKGLVQSNEAKIKVIILWIHINMRNKGKKVSANYHCEKYEEIFAYFLLNETKKVFFPISLNKF